MKKLAATLMTLMALALIPAMPAAADDTAESAPTAININTASAEELSALPGIGEKKAADIIEERKAHGNYDSVDSLTRVKGIGESTVDGLRDRAAI
ncbi:competence protein ComEA [Kushneria sinocarnis]|uniref:Competence protein ComEA n=2 Tax=Kushneria sinocarnis TaxID=595502 RepID=A0A420WVA5_9GAMM|nr:competence protein ComEA [Kushneria sinocarnis]